jgi:hypothetical protein
MQQLRAGRSAIVAPGGGYGPDGPLLMYARLAVVICPELSGQRNFG